MQHNESVPHLFVLAQGNIAYAYLSTLFCQKYVEIVGFSCPQSWHPFIQHHIQHKHIILHASDTRDNEGLNLALKKSQADTILSIQYNWIIPPEHISLVKGRAYNFHNAHLPTYRGYNAMTHIILNQDKTHHPTIHQIVTEVDRGQVCYEGTIPVAVDETAVSLWKKSLPVAIQLISTFLNDLSLYQIPSIRNIDQGGTFYPKNSVQKLKQVHPGASMEDIERLVRALYFPPYELPYFKFNDRKIYLSPQL